MISGEKKNSKNVVTTYITVAHKMHWKRRIRFRRRELSGGSKRVYLGSVELDARK